MVFQHPGKADELVCLFTCLELPAAEIFALYGLRWNIEQDIRALKRQLRLDQLTSLSVDMAEKELLMAVAAYNLVRAAICLAARQAGVAPRRLSFTHAQYVLRAAWPALLQAPSAEAVQRKFKQILDRIAQGALPNRPKRRSYPRATWGKGAKFPCRHNSAKPESTQ